MPVSIRSNEHEKIALVDSDEYNCRLIEMSFDAYLQNDLADVDSPLWYIDSAIYVLSATTPFSQQDVTAIKHLLHYLVVKQKRTLTHLQKVIINEIDETKIICNVLINIFLEEIKIGEFNFFTIFTHEEDSFI